MLKLITTKYMENKQTKQRVIEVKVPKEIWDASMSICNWNRDVMGAWMRSVEGVVKQIRNKQ